MAKGHTFYLARAKKLKIYCDKTVVDKIYLKLEVLSLWTLICKVIYKLARFNHSTMYKNKCYAPEIYKIYILKLKKNENKKKREPDLEM